MSPPAGLSLLPCVSNFPSYVSLCGSWGLSSKRQFYSASKLRLRLNIWMSPMNRILRVSEVNGTPCLGSCGLRADCHHSPEVNGRVLSALWYLSTSNLPSSEESAHLLFATWAHWGQGFPGHILEENSTFNLHLEYASTWALQISGHQAL